MRRIIDSHAHIGRYGQWDCDPGLLLSQMDAAGIRVHMVLRSDHSRAIHLISECSNLYGDTTFVSTQVRQIQSSAKTAKGCRFIRCKLPVNP